MSRILLAFSGGVDSSVAAYLCRESGFDVLAVNMRLLPGSPDTSDMVRKAADHLGVELRFLDLQEEFQESVMRRCWEVFASGKTPNPCGICNPVFKFGTLMRFARENGCDAMATGHYVRKLENGMLARGVHRAKDQSYFLFGLSKEQIAFARFPLGSRTKDEVRALAASLGLPNAAAKESQDACFTPPEGTLAEFLRKKFDAPVQYGNFIHAETGEVLGRHQGIHAYTVGQRKGTGIALGTPAYVQRIDAERRAVYITPDETALLRRAFRTGSVNWQTPDIPDAPFRADVQIRYRTPAAPATVTPCPDGSAEIVFDTPMRAITPGQAAVVYSGETLLGGGLID